MKSKLLALMAIGGLALSAAAQENEASASQQQDLDVVLVLPEPDRVTAREVLVAMQPTDRAMAVTLIRELKPEVAVLVTRSLYRLNLSPVTTPDPGDTFTDPMAFDIVFSSLEPADQPAFRTAWETTFSEPQKRSFVTLVRRAHFGGFTSTPAVRQDTPPPIRELPPTDTEVTMTTGTRAQPLAEPAAAAFARFSMDLTPVEHSAYLRNFSQLPPDQAAVIAKAIAQLNDMGKSGATTEKQAGISGDDAYRMMLSTLDGADRSTFESAWPTINHELKFNFMTLARDAINKGLKDA